MELNTHEVHSFRLKVLIQEKQAWTCARQNGSLVDAISHDVGLINLPSGNLLLTKSDWDESRGWPLTFLSLSLSLDSQEIVNCVCADSFSIAIAAPSIEINYLEFKVAMIIFESDRLAISHVYFRVKWLFQ